jgi:hypothetical protein
MGKQLDLFAPREPRPTPTTQCSKPEAATAASPSIAALLDTDRGAPPAEVGRPSDLLRALRKVETALREAQRQGAPMAALEELEREHQTLRRLHVQAFERLPSQKAVIAALFEVANQPPSADLVAGYDDLRRAYAARSSVNFSAP